MKYFALLWTGLWRKKARTIFTFISIAVAFLLFGTLQGIDTSFNQLVDTGRLNVLVTASPAGLPLPLADLSRIQSVPGVTGVTYRGQLIGYYQSLRNIVVALPVEPASFFSLNAPVFTVSPAALDAFIHTRTGALITPVLAQRFHWKVGDQVPFKALQGAKKDGSSDWTVDIVGIFDAPGNPVREQSLLLMGYDYFDTARATDNGTVQVYTEKISDASKAGQLANAIDNLFANSPAPTHTDTERATAQAQLAQIGNLDFFVDAIVGAAFFTLLLLTGNTMMQSFRERIREFAVMKTVGFTDAGVAALVLGESVLLAGGAAVIGLLGARGLLPRLASAAGGLIPGVHLPLVTFLAGLAAAVVLALLATLPAAWRAQRLSITAALVAR